MAMLKFTILGDGTIGVAIKDEYKSSVENITIPATYNGRMVTQILDEAFMNCVHLKNINIPNSVTSIGISAFRNCTSLVSIVLPENLTSIGGGEGSNTLVGAFSYCTSLKSIVIPEGVTSIKVSVFAYCTSLTKVYIPSSVTSINQWAFTGATALTEVYFGNTFGWERRWRSTTNTGTWIPVSGAVISDPENAAALLLERYVFPPPSPTSAYYEWRCN